MVAYIISKFDFFLEFPLSVKLNFVFTSISLDALCKRYRIDNSKRTQHTALIDCDLLAKVYINLIDQREPTLDFQKQDENSKFSENNKILYFKKIVEPNKDELLK